MTEKNIGPAGPQGERGERGPKGDRGKTGKTGKPPISQRHLPRLIVRYIAVVVTFGAILTAVSAIKASKDLKTNLISACEENRAPLQVYFGKQLADAQSRDISYYQQRFPDFPPDELRDLIAEQIADLTAVTEVYDPAKCEAQYN